MNSFFPRHGHALGETSPVGRPGAPGHVLEGAGGRVLDMPFEHHPSSPRRVRVAVRALVEGDEEIASHVEMVASELVANVIQHTDGPGTARAWYSNGDATFRLEVSDHDGRRPVARETANVGGHGLAIVDALSQRRGVEVREGGKTVWVEFDRTPIEESPGNGEPDQRVVIVTASDGERLAGCAVSFFTQCGTSPERHAVWLSKRTMTYRVATLASHFAIHQVTDPDRADLVRRFGEESGLRVDKFAGVDWTSGPSGVPLLTDVGSTMVLRRTAMWDDGSDYVCLVGERSTEQPTG